MPLAQAPQIDFDDSEAMVRRQIGPAYQYHTNLRSTTAHPTRESVDYALTLLLNPTEAHIERASRILRRVLPLQVNDPASKWYGIWGWYLEEPPDKMSPADWNWADFLGSTLLMIHHYAASHLADDLLDQIKTALLHAARSIERRNVSMNYTNIAIKGTFVTRAAAKLLHDEALTKYSDTRLSRLKAAIDATGTFAEYNSPTYALVSMRNLVRLRLLAPDPRAAAIERRLWLHLGKHWHQPTRQLAGPMSRLYKTVQPRYTWIETGLGNNFTHTNLTTEDDLLPWHCPEDLRPLFAELNAPRTHRELFIPAPTPGEFVQGTTYLHPRYSLGSTNRSNFWNQSAAVIAYGPNGGFFRLRFFHDDYDFSSALVFTVQHENRVLGLVNFRSPGGDKHISLDPLPEQFKLTQLKFEPEMNHLPHHFKAKLIGTRSFKEPTEVSWADMPNAHGYFALEIHPDGVPPEVEYEVKDGLVHLAWGNLTLTGLAKVDTVNALDAAFRSTIDGQPLPYMKLEE